MTDEGTREKELSLAYSIEHFVVYLDRFIIFSLRYVFVHRFYHFRMNIPITESFHLTKLMYKQIYEDGSV